MKGIPFDIQFAGVTTPFEPENLPTLWALVKAVQNNLHSMATRLNNLERIM